MDVGQPLLILRVFLVVVFQTGLRHHGLNQISQGCPLTGLHVGREHRPPTVEHYQKLADGVCGTGGEAGEHSRARGNLAEHFNDGQVIVKCGGLD